MNTYRELVAVEVPTRVAASLAGVSRAMANRKPRVPLPVPAVPLVPANRLTDAERARVLEVVNSKEFVDLPPIQIYARLLDAGIYLASTSTIYRILAENKQVKERRRLARHPARAIPELVATGPGQVYSWDITKLPGPIKGKYFDCYVMIDIYSRYIVARLGWALRQWSEAFLGYFDTGGASNGGTEAVNGLIELHRRVARVARGFRNYDNYRLRMLLIGGGPQL